MHRPLIAITMGDPAGVGPELCVQALRREALYAQCRPLIIGDAYPLERAAESLGVGKPVLHRVSGPKEGRYAFGCMDVLDMGAVDKDTFSFGTLSPMCGNAAYLYVEKAIGFAMAHQVDATVTNPLNKEAMNLAGHHYAGHTEIYAALTGARQSCMMLAFDKMLISHVSTHVSLREACDRVKKERILNVIRLTAEAAAKIAGKERVKIAVAGLNPHSGENGLFGREEIEEILPAIREARAEGFDTEGPVPPDTVFSKLRGGWYDAVVAMYHDQGHIPLKTLGFVYDQALGKWKSVSGVNITLGLPIIRTSVDHGTAFDIAGKGIADATSLLNAIDAAMKLG